MPDFVDDCGEDLNEGVGTAAGLLSIDQQTYDAVLCRGEVDYYQIEIPPGQWVSVEIAIEGGTGQTDLDLYETDAAGEDVWLSAAEQPYERLAWYNPSEAPTWRYLRVEGYRDAAAVYQVVVRASELHDGPDCDAFYPDAPREGGPCNEILQFPQSQDREAEAFYVEHDAHYSNLRREVVYLVRWAAAETALAFDDTNPLALMDMSERDGSTPGTMVGRLRHPEGTHVYGNDIDIAYYQTGSDNSGRIVCPQNDGYFCTGPASLLDARRTAFFIAKLMTSRTARVIGVDPKIAEQIQPAAWDLVDEGLLTREEAQKVNGNKLAFGSGWPFHHHHLHFSWTWEDGIPMRQDPVDGCITERALDPYALE